MVDATAVTIWFPYPDCCAFWCSIHHRCRLVVPFVMDLGAALHRSPPLPCHPLQVLPATCFSSPHVWLAVACHSLDMARASPAHLPPDIADFATPLPDATGTSPLDERERDGVCWGWFTWFGFVTTDVQQLFPAFVLLAWYSSAALPRSPVLGRAPAHHIAGTCHGCDAAIPATTPFRDYALPRATRWILPTVGRSVVTRFRSCL